MVGKLLKCTVLVGSWRRFNPDWEICCLATAGRGLLTYLRKYVTLGMLFII